MLKRALMYGFPFFLILIEVILREASGLETHAFLGPTLASVGLGLLLPLVKPRDSSFVVSDELKKELKIKKLSARSVNEERFIDFVWIFIFVVTAAWVVSLFWSTSTPSRSIYGIPDYLCLGLAGYFVGVTFSEIKEVAFSETKSETKEFV